MRPGERALVTVLGKQGEYQGEYGAQAVVRLDDGRTLAFDPAEVVPVQQRAAPAKNLKLVVVAGEDEEDVQAKAILALSRTGFIVLQTSVRYHAQQCRECGTWARPTGGTGTTPGVPDLLVSHEEWPEGLWLGVEMKDSDGGLQLEQKLLLAQARIVVARAAEAALQAAHRCGDRLTRAFPAPALDRAKIADLRAKVQEAKIARAVKNAQKRRGAKGRR